ncbi:MAG TPA: GAF domain-containing protein [Thermoanaerobaculia bacterium]|nr:GAF domain-containing protein [Thermoanaerobaculia bacterium]
MSDESRAEKFLELFNKSREFTEELLRENERLRRQLGILEEQTKDYAARYTEIEQQNNNLASLYVASYQLHSTLDFREVIHVVQEIIRDLIGAKAYAILLLDERTSVLQTVACDGEDVMPGVEKISTRIGEGIIGEVARRGETYYLDRDDENARPTLQRPLAAIPLKIKDQVIGVIAIYRLLVHKPAFTAVDYELFALLAAHAATAIFSAKLYSQSERKLNTIQSFLDLLTTTS